MEPYLAEETARLTRSWMRHPTEMLRDYMVAGIHDPRLNPQSIQARHFLIERACGARFCGLMEEEFHFAIAMKWLQERAKSAPDELPIIGHALERGADNAEGLAIPIVVQRAWRRLPCDAGRVGVPHYVRDALEGGGDALDAFAKLWRETLASETAHERLSVIEPACGSASDYRAFDAYGLGQLMAYEGFDLCEKNVANARAMFPDAHFSTGNVFAIAHPDESFDCCVVHDLLEHLSLAGLERAIAELCRVTRHGLCIGLFQMHEGPEHIVRPVEEYHWNTLSLPRVKMLFAQHGWSAQAVHVNTWLRWRVGGDDDAYYDSAYTLFCQRNGESQ